MSTQGLIRLQMPDDQLNDLLDDLAALAAHWVRNRERGRTPFAIRGALLMVARDALLADEMMRQSAPPATRDTEPKP